MTTKTCRRCHRTLLPDEFPSANHRTCRRCLGLATGSMPKDATDDEFVAYLPTPEEIAAACAEFRRRHLEAKRQAPKPQLVRLGNIRECDQSQRQAGKPGVFFPKG